MVSQRGPSPCSHLLDLLPSCRQRGRAGADTASRLMLGWMLREEGLRSQKRVLKCCASLSSPSCCLMSAFFPHAAQQLITAGSIAQSRKGERVGHKALVKQRWNTAKKRHEGWSSGGGDAGQMGGLYDGTTRFARSCGYKQQRLAVTLQTSGRRAFMHASLPLGRSTCRKRSNEMWCSSPAGGGE